MQSQAQNSLALLGSFKEGGLHYFHRNTTSALGHGYRSTKLLKMPTLETYHGYPLWRYIPSLPAAILFSILFGLATLLHAFNIYRRRMWFCIPFVIGGCCKHLPVWFSVYASLTFLVGEVIGYIGRGLAYNATGQLGPYVMQSVLLLLAPVLFAASLYMTLGRVIRAVHAEQDSIIPPRWLTRVFVIGDCFSFLIQASGAGLIVRASQITSGNSSPDLGQNIIVGGLLFQIVMFGLFCIVAAVFHLRFRKTQSIETPQIRWQRTIGMLYLTSAGIMTRNIFRTIQYVMGQDGYALTHEWYLYIFDSLLMFAVMAIFWWYGPETVAPPHVKEGDMPLCSQRSAENVHQV
jgi:RTA1 like protein